MGVACFGFWLMLGTYIHVDIPAHATHTHTPKKATHHAHTHTLHASIHTNTYTNIQRHTHMNSHTYEFRF
jgi:hypothetical protein